MKENTQDSEAERKKTYAIPPGTFNTIEQIFDRFMQYQKPFGFQYEEVVKEYHPIPYVPGDEDKNNPLVLETPWRVILELYEQGGKHQRLQLGLDLYGDVVLGRAESRPGRIILNLSEYGASELGVSHEHALIRPTMNKLFIIDQGSTNGTLVNGIPVGRGIATKLQDQAMINLGKMVMMVHIIKQPGDADTD